MMRIGPSGWKIHPEADLAAETSEQALSRGSAFRRELHVADENAVITIWVYPDSFGVTASCSMLPTNWASP